MIKKHVIEVLNEKYTFYVENIIKVIISLEGDHCQSGSDSPLKNVWEEWKFQLQIEESVLCEIYEETIREIISWELKKLPCHELKFLWILTDGYFDYEEEEGYPTDDHMLLDIEEEILSKINSIAVNETISPVDWYDYFPKNVSLKEIEVIVQIQQYANYLEELGLDSTDYLPKDVQVVGYNNLVIPKNVCVSELVSGSTGSDWINYSNDTAINIIEDILVNLEEMTSNENWFKNEFKLKLYEHNNYTVEELLREDNHTEKLMITYQVIFDIFFNKKPNCNALIYY